METKPCPSPHTAVTAPTLHRSAVGPPGITMIAASTGFVGHVGPCRMGHLRLMSINTKQACFLCYRFLRAHVTYSYHGYPVSFPRYTEDKASARFQF